MAPKLTADYVITDQRKMLVLTVMIQAIALAGTQEVTDQITVCNCDKPVFMGILGTDEQEHCKYSNKQKKEIREIEYREITRVETPLTSSGYLCRAWESKTTIVGDFYLFFRL